MQKPRIWLQEKRVTKNMTHEEVAQKANIHRAYYTMLETGYRGPSVDVAKRIATVLGFDWTLFFADIGDETKQAAEKEACHGRTSPDR